MKINYRDLYYKIIEWSRQAEKEGKLEESRIASNAAGRLQMRIKDE